MSRLLIIHVSGELELRLNCSIRLASTLAGELVKSSPSGLSLETFDGLGPKHVISILLLRTPYNNSIKTMLTRTYTMPLHTSQGLGGLEPDGSGHHFEPMSAGILTPTGTMLSVLYSWLTHLIPSQGGQGRRLDVPPSTAILGTADEHA
ncbi:hypothetical protein H113_08164 [Trichophyton rubrum MR1459]|uniref:Uncharacterized protein n=3 Tax=Trichophyton TaxID=5550 RepID=F2SCR5_TRIRC|nr:uncharacterized protein TERG_08662 [Trichophyton rubrum CBS 118892]EZF48172.1 hypothetical protein H103_08101 [Trichophyton rubrum CBS 288.86]EZF58835.1 hypothetical protein H104_08048 [Trichophyton rubrum CBS 289.86]EZF69426.1 hypothetical protein H105_08100 [Trichophyton soudanense CBS 452.61]EZF80080.1 hypothetical protein H110_08102 [Trichophyton rubrum MR1448]EZF90758.1 hypothetical protein H113_08164 [Trichophyton rubrum MR1459]EZG01933.1 hypothetical protein H106_07971 [Trichophyton